MQSEHSVNNLIHDCQNARKSLKEAPNHYHSQNSRVVSSERNEEAASYIDQKLHGKAEEASIRRVSTRLDEILSESKPNENSNYKSDITPNNSEKFDNKQFAPEDCDLNEPQAAQISKEERIDPDYKYTETKKANFEYNRRKDVILKTILRKWRRVLQNDFNDVTQYFPNRKHKSGQFLKDCVMKYYNHLPNKPEQLDLVFFLGSMLYPQEMIRGVDFFFEWSKEDKVKQRKIVRSKIQKVHDVLYRYCHEKMNYFVSVPELSYLYVMFYKKEISNSKMLDKDYFEGVTEIYKKCQLTLESSNIFI